MEKALVFQLHKMNEKFRNKNNSYTLQIIIFERSKVLDKFSYVTSIKSKRVPELTHSAIYIGGELKSEDSTPSTLKFPTNVSRDVYFESIINTFKEFAFSLKHTN